MNHYRATLRESSLRKLEVIDKVGRQYFHARLQPTQRQMLKMAVGIGGFILCLLAAFSLASSLSIKPFHAIFIFGPVVMGVPLMAFAANGLTKYLELCRNGTHSWLTCLASEVADYFPEHRDAYERMVSAILANSLSESDFDTWLNEEYRALYSGETIPPFHFGKGEWKTMMRLSGRYEDIKA